MRIWNFILSLALAVVLALAVRAFVITVYVVPDGIGAGLVKGDRVVVNRLSHARLKRGDVIVYRRGKDEFMGRVTAVPGDTITYRRNRFVIPDISRCPFCGSTRCRHYLVVQGQTSTLVRQTEITGRVRLLFSMGWWTGQSQ